MPDYAKMLDELEVPLTRHPETCTVTMSADRLRTLLRLARRGLAAGEVVEAMKKCEHWLCVARDTTDRHGLFDKFDDAVLDARAALSRLVAAFPKETTSEFIQFTPHWKRDESDL